MSKKSDERKRLLNGSTAKTKYEQNKKYVAKYHSKFDDIKIRVPKGERDAWKFHASAQGKSLTQYVVDLVHADMGGAPELPSGEDTE
ncbi:MAG: hypothetical protein Q4D42_10620 [Eubacteriales bacterium]|nr:hypothetical protein [Eubacteriales bacterium]